MFAKEPVAGNVKTRLGKSIGMQPAADLYAKLLRQTWTNCCECAAVTPFFFITEESRQSYFEKEFQTGAVVRQRGKDLGEKMANAFAQLFADGFCQAVIIGSDVPKISREHIEQAFTILDKKEIAVGPTQDGGYYLLGMKKQHPILFENIEWSTSSVYRKTIEKLTAAELGYQTLAELRDIDTADDLKSFGEYSPFFN